MSVPVKVRLAWMIWPGVPFVPVPFGLNVESIHVPRYAFDWGDG